MRTSVIMSGFGGQGILLMGQVLAQYAMDLGKEVTWIPSYGAEQRGGAASCTVVFADDPIGSPVVRHPDTLVLLSAPAVQKFHARVREGGLVIVDAAVEAIVTRRADVSYLDIDSVAEAEALGDHRIANMVLLGAYLGRLGIFDRQAVHHSLERVLGTRRSSALELNMRALERGRDLAAAS